MQVVNVPSYDIVGILQKWIIWLIHNGPGLLQTFLAHLVIIALPVCMMLVIGIIFAIDRTKAIRRKEKEIYYPKVDTSFIDDSGDEALTSRWKTITEHVESENQNDWRQAIMEADIILNEILDKMGYKGESIGEKLKRVEKADFNTLDQAWEAHKIRNVIAHEGASYSLTQYEAKRVIGLYREVFEEFYYI